MKDTLDLFFFGVYPYIALTVFFVGSLLLPPTVAALLAERMQPGTLSRCIVSHCSAEPAHRLLLEQLRIEPLLSLGLRLGEGSGALLAAIFSSPR